MAFGREKKSAWEVQSAKDTSEQIQYRDVYEDQQLERSTIEGKQTATSRIIFSVVVAVFAAVLMWGLVGVFQYGISFVQSATSSVTSLSGSGSISSQPKLGEYNPNDEYGYAAQKMDSTTGVVYAGYYQVQADGTLGDQKYETKAEVPVPEWWTTAKAAYEAAHASESSSSAANGSSSGILAAILAFNIWKLLISLATGGIVFALMYTVMMRNLQTQNMMNDTTDINQYHNDQHIALPEETMQKFDWFPDVGAHSSVSVSSMISHVALQNKGINPVDVTQRATEDVLDEDGDVEYYEGEPLLDEHGKAIVKKEPLFDKKFMESVFTASYLPEGKSYRKYYDATKIPYNPGNKIREKLSGYDTVADLINGDWIFPEYETQRPGGAYIVDTNPVNTLVWWSALRAA